LACSGELGAAPSSLHHPVWTAADSRTYNTLRSEQVWEVVLYGGVYYLLGQESCHVEEEEQEGISWLRNEKRYFLPSNLGI
jgi:hypothetical protein